MKPNEISQCCNTFYGFWRQYAAQFQEIHIRKDMVCKLCGLPLTDSAYNEISLSDNYCYTCHNKRVYALAELATQTIFSTIRNER